LFPANNICFECNGTIQLLRFGQKVVMVI